MVIIFLGSKADLDWGKEIAKYLKEFHIDYKLHIASAHKTPEYLLKLIQQYEEKKEKLVYICVAGRSNALGGFIDANVVHPVINCPPFSEKFAGLDILSSLRMPTGVSVSTVLEPSNAALAAVKILALTDTRILTGVKTLQNKLKEKIIHDDEFLPRDDG